jgi:hypothetical protein
MTAATGMWVALDLAFSSMPHISCGDRERGIHGIQVSFNYNIRPRNRPINAVQLRLVA